MERDELEAAVDSVCRTDPARLADGETVEALHRQLARLEAVGTRAGCVRGPAGLGARSAAAWLAVRCHLPVPSARRRAHLGRALRHLPAVEPAWLAGDIGEAQVALFAAARTPAAAAAMECDEATLVERARTLRYQRFARAMAYWRQLADKAGAQGGAQAQHDAPCYGHVFVRT